MKIQEDTENRWIERSNISKIDTSKNTDVYRTNENLKRIENKHTRQRIAHISNTIFERNEQMNQLSVGILLVLTSIGKTYYK